ncbi:hypothetical protein NDU88_009392 [Pleurodeles waltl]|uniref:Uncharacterized protein n=1 Tax=Pleurodeles waltl TaxID=8319 RepID=A0AAV7QV17_PLEWA|nr:hypothetical protein NDU88_009392 [Pleurodeles waltl]
MRCNAAILPKAEVDCSIREGGSRLLPLEEQPKGSLSSPAQRERAPKSLVSQTALQHQLKYSNGPSGVPNGLVQKRALHGEYLATTIQSGIVGRSLESLRNWQVKIKKPNLSQIKGMQEMR